jgi:hypothetical protein
MKNLLIILVAIILQSCISFEDIEINVNVTPITANEPSDTAAVEIDFHVFEGEMWSTLEPQFIPISHSNYFDLALDGRNLHVKLKKGKFVKLKNIWVDNCENNWFSIHYYSDTEAEIYLQSYCYQSVIQQEQIMFNLKILI